MEPRWSYSGLLPALIRQLLRPREHVFQEVQAGVVHVLRDLGQQVFRVFVDLHLVRLGCLHQAVNNRAGLGTVDSVNDVPVGAANGERPDCTLCSGIIDGDLTVFQEYFQVFLLVQAEFQTVSRLLTQNRSELLFVNPCKVSLHKGLYFLLAVHLTFFNHWARIPMVERLRHTSCTGGWKPHYGEFARNCCSNKKY